MGIGMKVVAQQWLMLMKNAISIKVSPKFCVPGVLAKCKKKKNQRCARLV